jgi:hypothetical protein
MTIRKREPPLCGLWRHIQLDSAGVIRATTRPATAATTRGSYRKYFSRSTNDKGYFNQPIYSSLLSTPISTTSRTMASTAPEAAGTSSEIRPRQPIWLRCEKKPFEHRSALTPTTAKTLLDNNFEVFVERDPQRIFEDEEFEA